MNAMDDYTLFNILSNLPNKWLFRCIRVNKQFHAVTLSILRPRSFDYDFEGNDKRRIRSRRLSLQYVSRLFDGLVYRYSPIRGRKWNATHIHEEPVPEEDLNMFSKFKFIELCYITMRDYQMEYLCDCEKLILSQTYITDAGLKYLKKCIELDISYSIVTNEGLKYLASLTSLKHLKIYHCRRITNEALAYFDPNVKIEMLMK